MKGSILSNVEKNFLLKALSENKRLDGRHTQDYRNLRIKFGVEGGCCEVGLGDTRVFCQVSCDIVVPQENRPAEGRLFLNVEYSPMASPNIESGRSSLFGIELSRLLEKCIKDCRAVDTESLCLIAHEKVWEIRIDLHIINHDGNILDCSSIAAISALSKFKRPNVTVKGGDITIHSLEDLDPIPLSIHHIPLTVTFAFFEEGNSFIIDPTEKEERVCDGSLVISLNAHRQLCYLQMSGNMLLFKEKILQCSKVAIIKISEIADAIKKSFQNNENIMFPSDSSIISSDPNKKITENRTQSHLLHFMQTENETFNTSDIKGSEKKFNDTPSVLICGSNTTQIVDKKCNKWFFQDDTTIVNENTLSKFPGNFSEGNGKSDVGDGDDNDNDMESVKTEIESVTEFTERCSMADNDKIDLSIALKKNQSAKNFSPRKRKEVAEKVFNRKKFK